MVTNQCHCPKTVVCNTCNFFCSLWTGYVTLVAELWVGLANLSLSSIPAKNSHTGRLQANTTATLPSSLPSWFQPVAVDWQVSRTDDPQDSNIAASAQYSHMKRSMGSRLPWAPEIAESDMAYAWSKCLAPVYAFNLIGLRAACKYRVYMLSLC